MDKVALSFSTNAKLEKLIGRELITNNIIAIFELITINEQVRDFA